MKNLCSLREKIIIKFNCCHHDLFSQEQNTTNDDELAGGQAVRQKQKDKLIASQSVGESIGLLPAAIYLQVLIYEYIGADSRAKSDQRYSMSS